MRSKKFFEKAALLCCGYGLMSDAVIVPLATSILREFPDTSEVLLNFIMGGAFLFSLVSALITGRIIHRLNKKKVLLLGTRNDVPDILQAMDAFLLPSFSEGLPVSAIDAQATGLPCYISNTVSHEVDITGLCRFLPINKPEAWTDAIFHETAIREDASAKIKTAGYDINDTSLWLQDFYLEIAKRGK